MSVSKPPPIPDIQSRMAPRLSRDGNELGADRGEVKAVHRNQTRSETPSPSFRGTEKTCFRVVDKERSREFQDYKGSASLVPTFQYP